MLVWSQIWKREVEERLQLHNLHIDQVMIRWELRYLIGAKVAGTVKWNCSSGWTRPNNCGFMSSPGNNPTKTKWVRFLVVVWNRTESFFRSKPSPLAGYLDLLLTLYIALYYTILSHLGSIQLSLLISCFCDIHIQWNIGDWLCLSWPDEMWME